MNYAHIFVPAYVIKSQHCVCTYCCVLKYHASMSVVIKHGGNEYIQYVGLQLYFTAISQEYCTVYEMPIPLSTTCSVQTGKTDNSNNNAL